MNERRMTIGWVLVLALATRAAAGGPELSVGATCDADKVGTGTTVTVPIEFRAGIADGGQANAVSAADLAVTFAAAAFDVSEVRLPQPLAASGSWALDWQRTLGLPETPGRIGLAVAPQFQYPLPTLSDGTIAEVVLVAKAAGQSQCVGIEIPPDSVVFSTPPLGLAVAPGPIANGGVAVTELCRDCADNDGDGLVDLDDPDCAAGTIARVGRRPIVRVKGKKKQKVTVRGTLPAAFESFTGPLQVSLRAAGEPAACLTLETACALPKGKKKTRVYACSAGTTKAMKLISNLKAGRTTISGNLPGLTVPAGASTLSVSIWAGDQPFHATVTLRKGPTKGRGAE